MAALSEKKRPSPARRVRLLYMAVLSTIALLSILGQLAIQRALTKQVNDSHAISVAGRQLTLGQKIGRTALAIHNSTDENERQALAAELRHVVQLWRRSHEGLQHGDVELGLLQIDSPEATRLFAKIEPHYQAILHGSETVLAALSRNGVDGASKADLASSVQGILTQESAFLDGATEIVFQYVRESGAHTAQLQWVERSFFSLVIAILLIGALVVRTAARKVDRTIVEVEQAEQRLSAVLNTAAEGIITFDSSGTIVMVNREGQQMWGYREDELIGQSLRLLVPEGLAPSPASATQDLGDGITRVLGQRLELEGRRKDGSTFPLEARVTETMLQDQLLFTAAVSDITERKQADERQAKLLKELESSNQELREFAYVVSHDLKAPLRAIGSLTAWISTDYGQQLDAEGQEMIRLLVSRVKRMEGLIDGILQYSRLGRVREEKVPINLNESVPAAIDILTPPDHVEILIENELPIVYGERTRLNQIFQNLLSNAIKFMDKSKGVIRIGCEPDGPFWRFKIADNGPGIEQRYFDKIFQIFQTLNSRDEFESSGIGLTLVRKIVEMYHGKVWLESKVGEGTTFYFTLPRDEPSSQFRSLEDRHEKRKTDSTR